MARGLGLMLVAGAVLGWATTGPAYADDTAQPAEGAEGTGGEGSDCGDCGADTVDKKDGDVCPEDKDCESCETGGADEGQNADLIYPNGVPVPVAWDTGEKWESVVDLVVRVNGEDFELIRNYTSDPWLIGDLYNSRYIPDTFEPEYPFGPGQYEGQARESSPVNLPDISPSVGKGWAFSHLRSVTVSESWTCVSDPDCRDVSPGGPLRGEFGAYIGGRVWLNRPGRKPRTFDISSPIIDVIFDSDIVQSPLNATGSGNQSVAFIEAEVENIFPSTGELPCREVCDGEIPYIVPTRVSSALMRLYEPGKWAQDYEIIDGVGFIVHHEDTYGNSRTFVDSSSDADRGPTGLADRIILNGTTTSNAEAWIDLYWRGTSTDPILVRAEVYRPTSTDPVMTQFVDYYHLVDDDGLKIKHYAPDTVSGDKYVTDGTPSSHLGNAGDLVQVVVGEVIDPLAGSPEWRTTVTQYRYHGNGAPSSSDIRLDTTGLDHQLKMVFRPQQVEYVAQLIREEDPLGIDDMTLVETATGLLTLDDDEAIYDSAPVSVFEAAEKIVSYNTSVVYDPNKTVGSPVEHQFIQASDCGCGGGGAVTAKLRTYEQVDGWTTALPDDWAATSPGSLTAIEGQSMHIKEHILTGFSAMPTGDPYRIYTQDMLMLAEDKPYVWLKTTIDGASEEMVWVSENLYDYDKRSLIGKYFPSTFTAYSPAEAQTPPDDPTPPSVTHVADNQGYMIQYGYESHSETGSPDNENISTVSKGPKGFPALVSKTIHRSDKSFRKHLPATRELYRVAGSTAEKEVTEETYGFSSTDPFQIIWRQTKQERELVSENGSGITVVSSWEFYDPKGNVILTMDEGGTVTRYDYDGLTGSLVKISENYFRDESLTWEQDVPGLNQTGANSLPSSKNGDPLFTEFERDLLGRVTKTITPGVVETWTVRQLLEDSERPGILYHAVLTLPHQVGTGEFAGPAAVRYVDASGETTRMETMPIGSGTYDPDNGDWALDDGPDDILSRVVVTHDLSGAVSKTTAWWDYATGVTDRKHETEFTYDALGRLTEVTDPSGTITKRTYDVLDRVVRIDQTTTAPSTYILPVALYYYDADPNSGDQGVGNGNLTRIEARTIDANSGAIRETRLYYDFRNRLIGVAPDDGPISITRYDNLDRPIESALYPNDSDPMPLLADVRTLAGGALPNSAAIGNSMGSVTRAQYSRMYYSQRGLMYRTETAIDPGSASPTFLASNYWFDDDGNTLATWEPNSPGTATEYDAHDRPVTMWLTDRAGDTNALNNVSRYYQAISPASDNVIEQVDYEYDATSGVLNLVTNRLRPHDISSTGTLSADDDFAVTTYAGFLYDSALRPTVTINFGTNQAAFQAGTTTAPSLSAYSGGLSSLLADGDILFTHRTYNSRGLIRDVTNTQDGDALRTRFVYDHLGRTIAVIENAVAVDESDISWSTDRYTVAGQSVDYPDRDRVTSFAYNGLGQVTARVAHIPESDGSSGSQESVQETRYVYGVTTGAGVDTNPMQSAIFSNHYLRSVNYPNESTGLADGTGVNSAYDDLRVSYAYNAQGELKGVTDQNGTVRWIHRDRSGRVRHDIVHNAGTYATGDVDDEVGRLTYSYDQLGRLVSAASHTDPDPGVSSVRDEVTFDYTTLWQIKTVAQQHDGPVTGSSPTVAYDYANAVPGTSDGNYSRLHKIIYPSDFTGAVDVNDVFTEDTVRFVYDSGIDDRIGRVTKLQVNGLTAAGLQNLISYDRIGMGFIARAELPKAGDVITGTSDTWTTVLDRTKNLNGSSTAGAYPGYDPFGRVTNHMWVRSDFGAGTGGISNQPPIVAVSHTYDRMSNKLTAEDVRPGAKLPFRDREFTYDDLNRLINEERTPTPASGYVEQHLAQAWNLDMLGNWNVLITDTEKDGNAADGTLYHENRAHNAANEIEDPSGSAQYDAWIANASGSAIGSVRRFAYDDAGNMTEQRGSPALPVPPTKMPGLIMTYDAWNRLIDTTHEPSVGSQVAVSSNRYNALGWRTVKRFDTSGSGYDGIDQQRVMLYDAGWRMVEERVDTDLDEDDDYVSQQFWGMRYIDDAVAKRVNRDLTDEDGWVNNPGVSVWYQLTDSQFSVTAVLDHKGSLYERVEYDAYGNAKHRPSGDANGDGLFSFADVSLFTGSGSIGSGGYHADWDLNFDGTVDTADTNILTAQGTRTTALRAGWISDPRAASTGPDNSIGYAGYVFNAERDDYTVRFRVYSPSLGRWRQRDPIGYADGSNLYIYAKVSPVVYADASGLAAKKPQETKKEDCEKDKSDREFHNRHGAYYDIVVNCNGKSTRYKGYSRVNVVAAKMKHLKNKGCCVMSMNLSTHHDEKGFWSLASKKDAVSDQAFANSFTACKGARIVLNACNSRMAACMILDKANESDNYNILITWTDGFNFHYPSPYLPHFTAPEPPSWLIDVEKGTNHSNREDGDPRTEGT
jgi:RHS repeat-associated protein